MRRKFFPVFLFLLCLSSFPARADYETSAKMLAANIRMHEIITELLKFAQERVEQNKQGNLPNSNEDLIGPVRDILAKEDDLDVLTGVAMALRGYQSNRDIGSDAVFDVYDEAIYQAVRRIEQIGGREALGHLYFMNGSGIYDGRKALWLHEAIERLKAKENPSKSQSSP